MALRMAVSAFRLQCVVTTHTHTTTRLPVVIEDALPPMLPLSLPVASIIALFLSVFPNETTVSVERTARSWQLAGWHGWQGNGQRATAPGHTTATCGRAQSDNSDEVSAQILREEQTQRVTRRCDGWCER